MTTRDRETGSAQLRPRARKGLGPLHLGWVLFLLVALLFVAHVGRAEEVTVPVGLQAELLVKVADYDRHFVQRAEDRVHVLLLTKPGNVESAHVATQMQAGLGRIDKIAGLPHDEIIVPYANAADLVATLHAKHISILFLGPGFRDDIEDIRKALVGVDVLSATGVPDYVPSGIVLGFDVVSGRPKLLVHLTQARLQKVDLRADLLKLMKVFE